MTTFVTTTDRIILGAGTDSERRIEKGGTVTSDQLEADGCQWGALVKAGLLTEKKSGSKPAADK